MSKMDTSSLKPNVIKKNVQGGTIYDQIQFVSDMFEKLTTLSVEDKSGNRTKKFPAEFLLWWILHYKIPLQEDIPTNEDGIFDLKELDWEAYEIKAPYLEAIHQYIVDHLSPVDHLDIFGHTVDNTTGKFERLRLQMVNFPGQLLNDAIQLIGNALKEHSEPPLEISYFEDPMAPMRMFQDIIGRAVAQIIRYPSMIILPHSPCKVHVGHLVYPGMN